MTRIIVFTDVGHATEVASDSTLAPELYFLYIHQMQIILFLIILSLTVAAGFLFAFFWAVRDGQFDDDVTPSMRILIDDDMLDRSSVSDDDTVSTTSATYVKRGDI